ncbi:hypothetical protein E0Z10_g9509 [Xylaria hypoxylon]|uniref:Ubiquitin-like protease family profile domain-containing protein n=1 Tax=Xylaria hypoxylon TaxID=37992 RepID=A0A4Z0Y8I1_9PEZI|nr:hypothetical protein E0Z10_g9509 [Xylaria hypoxylon]
MSQALRYRTAQNVCSASCPIQHIAIPMNQIKAPSNSWPDVRGLHSLNYSRDKWLAGDAIEVAIATYTRGLPQALQEKIGLGIPGVNPKVWHRGSAGNDALNMAIKTPARRGLARLRTTEYSILPVCTDSDHWVLVVLHKERRPTGPGNKIEWSHIAQVAVLDPYRDSARMRMVDERMQAWLKQAGKFTYSNNYRRVVWIPMQKDTTSCGPRAYWHAKQLLDRLLELHESGVDYSDYVWKDLSGWFNEDFVRGEMAGRCAWDGVRAMDYNARISIECVNRVKEYDRPKGAWKKAGELMKPADFSQMKPEKRPNPQNLPRPTPSNFNPFLTPPNSGGNPATPSSTNAGTSTSNTSMSNLPQSQPGSNWKPPVPVPHQHQIAPGVTAGGKEVIVIDDDGDKDNGPIVIGDDDDNKGPISKGPAFSQNPQHLPFLPVNPGPKLHLVLKPKPQPQPQPKRPIPVIDSIDDSIEGPKKKKTKKS